MGNLAWVLTELGELDDARKLHEQVLTIRWHNDGPCSWNSLALMEGLISTLARQAGIVEPSKLFEQAKEAALRGEDISPNIFLLAAAYWQLGDKEEARRWYDKAAEWVEEHKPNDKDLVRFRDEASKLITIEGEDKSDEGSRGLISGFECRRE